VGVLAYCPNVHPLMRPQNTADFLRADGRYGSVTLIQGDVELPSAQDLLDNFRCVIAMTDQHCGTPLPDHIADGAADALAGYVRGGGGAVLANFGFSHRPEGIGFGAATFEPGLSPFQQGTPHWNAPAGPVDVAGASTDPPCDEIMAGVTGSVSSLWANYVSLSEGATLCASYANGRDFLAVNAPGNVVGLNTYPANAYDIWWPSYRKLVSNAVYVACTAEAVLVVEIDIKPGGDPNSINCENEKGVITVAILTTDEFDATTVDHTTVRFAGATETHVDKKTGKPRRHEEDVDGDGDTDLVFHFRFGDTDLTCVSTEGTLTGATYDGAQIEGSDAVRMVGGDKQK